jgi:hypothetical protein
VTVFLYVGVIVAILFHSAVIIRIPTPGNKAPVRMANYSLFAVRLGLAQDYEIGSSLRDRSDWIRAAGSPILLFLAVLFLRSPEGHHTYQLSIL